MLVLLFLTGPIADLPKAVLGAVIVVACLGLVDLAAWRELWATDRVEVAIAAVTTGRRDHHRRAATRSLFAVGLSIVDVVRRSARPHDAVLGWDEELGRWADVSVHRGARVTPGVVVYRLDDRLFFANAGYVKGRVREALDAAPSEPHALVFDAEGMSHVDVAGLDALADLARRLPVTLYVARMKARRPCAGRGTPAPSAPSASTPPCGAAVEAAVAKSRRLGLRAARPVSRAASRFRDRQLAVGEPADLDQFMPARA